MSNKYIDAGVDIIAGEQLVLSIKDYCDDTHIPGVLNSVGGFNSLFSIPKEYKDPVLVSATDGVGTKLLLAQKFKRHKTIGIDLVAMCVNDIVTSGAKPLFFLDYLATGKLNLTVAQEVIEGISLGCKQAGCALIGGETAEMPGMYKIGHYDLAGFCVGIIERQNIIDGSKIQEGDVIIGMPSSGLHSNGFSLVRKVLEGIEDTFIEDLLTPTKIYVKECLALIEEYEIHGMANITGGGFNNVKRILPNGLGAIIHKNSWPIHDIFRTIGIQGQITDDEMYQIFNCGIGMIVILPKRDKNYNFGYTIGKVIKGRGVALR